MNKVLNSFKTWIAPLMAAALSTSPASAQDSYADPALLARAIKRLPLRLLRTRPIDEAISSAGGIAAASLDRQLMLRALPGVFAAGEMLDWEAPTGGYLLTACFASARVAAKGVLDFLESQSGVQSL